MNDDLASLQKYRNRAALLDASLLLIYIVGKYGRQYLTRCIHTKQYARDYDYVEAMVELFRVIHTTPNVLTEVSNLGMKLSVGFFDVLGATISRLEESYCHSPTAAAVSGFNRFGLTDAALLSIAKDTLIVTTDRPLYAMIRSQGLDAVNYYNVRPWLL